MGSPSAGAGPSAREHWLDNLRALAMLAGVVFHAMLAYSPRLVDVWPTATGEGAAAVDAAAWFLHAFRMPLFFVVAGWFTVVLMRRRGADGMLLNRLRRVGLPLLLLAPPLLWSLSALTEHAAMTAVSPSPLLRAVRALVLEHGGIPPMPTLAHLWFLLYLTVFSVLAWVSATLEWRLPPRLRAWLARPGVIVAGLPLLGLPALAIVPMPWPAPEFFAPQPWALLFFGPYFALGALLATQPAPIDAWRRHGTRLLIGSLLAFAAFFIAWPPFPVQPAWPLELALSLLYAATGTGMVLWCLQAGRTWLARPSRMMRYLADASYWLYLVHLPILFAIQYRLLDVALPWPLAFVVSVLGTFVLGLASYDVLVRRTPLARWLGASRPAARAPASVSPAQG